MFRVTGTVNFRWTSKVAVLAIVIVITGFSHLLEPASADAAVDHFCGFLYPGESCINDYQDHWDRVRTRYPGPQAHNVYACVYMWNIIQNRRRGGSGAIYCGYSWDTNPVGHNYGVTTQPHYRSFNMLASGNTPHTLVGWTSTNQTDG